MATATAVSTQYGSFFETTLADADPEIFGAIRSELGRQRHEIELIASENIVSRAVLEAQGSIMTNKYAEGYPGKRYYGGCQFVDIAEELAIERAKKLFSCNFANVQPNSGSQMNQAVFLALLQPGDTFMGLDLNSGGHLTHGSPVNMSGKWFKVVSYGVRQDDHLLDMDAIEKSAHETKPKLILAGGTAYSRIWDWKRFREIADSVGAYLMVDMAHIAGLVAGGQHPSPLPHAHVVTTTTHKSLRGPRGGMILTNHEDIAKKMNSAVFPGLQGGPLMHVIAAKAVAFGEALKPEFKDYAKSVVDNARTLAASLKDTGLGYRFGRHRQPSDAGRPQAEERDRQARGGSARPRQYHLQQERHPVRPGKALRHVGRAARNAGRHHARLRQGRIPRDRQSDRRGSRRAEGRQFRRRQRGGRSGGEEEGAGADGALSALSVSGVSLGITYLLSGRFCCSLARAFSRGESPAQRTSQSRGRFAVLSKGH